jgi:hypothetical protein
MAKILCVLYPDPVDGYPKSYARDDIPVITRYDNGQTVPTPKHIDFVPGELVGSVSGELGLRKFLESSGHEFVVTSDKEGGNSARAQICDRDAIVRALEAGLLAGYAGDVWYPQPAPANHPWRSMPYEGMTPHMSGTSLSDQAATPPAHARFSSAGWKAARSVANISSLTAESSRVRERNLTLSRRSPHAKPCGGGGGRKEG